MYSAVASGQNRGDGGRSPGCRTLEQLKAGCSSQIRGYLGHFTYWQPVDSCITSKYNANVILFIIVFFPHVKLVIKSAFNLTSYPHGVSIIHFQYCLYSLQFSISIKLSQFNRQLNEIPRHILYTADKRNWHVSALFIFCQPSFCECNLSHCSGG